MPKIPDVMAMLKSGVHFGHQVSRRHPKMKPYIFMVKNGFHIINVEQTQEMLKQALDFASETAQKGGAIMFVGTKKQAKPIVRKYAAECEMPFVTERWLGGTITNFSAIYKLVKKFRELTDRKAKGELSKYTKKEQLDFDREIEKLDTVVGGISKFDKTPDALFVVDIKKEKTAVREANRQGIPVIALCDTNVNPQLVQYPIPSNDDAIKSIEIMTQLVAEAINEGKAKASA